ncbi:hypothetical protein V2J09_000463 [Rumex salicifolius]
MQCKEGVPTFDVSTWKHFRMRAALMWTVNDFSAYGMLNGWSTAGALWRDNMLLGKTKKNFYKRRVEKDLSIPYLFGHQMWECVKDLPTTMESPCHYSDGYDETHKFTRNFRRPY